MLQRIKHLFEKGLLSNNQLKTIGIITMTLDHIGAYLLPEMEILRTIGRLAFPIFAYMIAEGCTYTKNRKKYLGTLCFVALAYQAIYFMVTKSLYMGIFVTFSLSVAFIYAMDFARTHKNHFGMSVLFAAFACVLITTDALPKIIRGFSVDYGFAGVMVPALVYGVRTKRDKLLRLFLGLVFLSGVQGGIQWYSLLAVPLIALYNQTRGKIRMKNFFYIYYPLHMAVIYLIGMAWKLF